MKNEELARFTSVTFRRFKAFKNFTIKLNKFNILVGPNNAGKSTILAGFRILSAALRKANSKSAEPVRGPNGTVLGHSVDLSSISVAEENIFYNYKTDEPAEISFSLSNGNSLLLYFPEPGACSLIPDTNSSRIRRPSDFKKSFNCKIGFVPILGPVDHQEPLYGMEAARLALFNYKAARNFRNIWHHYPEKFEEFRSLLVETWPGMNIERPEIDTSFAKPLLRMFCPEDRYPRELFWAGFGFQVWCQMLTHVVQADSDSIFLIDEPDIYWHSELQRQLLNILKELGPDIIIATHSTEIISEADADEILLVDKRRNSSKRLKNPSQVGKIFETLGSNANPILTQLAKTKCVLFVEGKDYQILSRFARKLNMLDAASRRNFAVIPVEGFNPERMKNIKSGIEATLGGHIQSMAILDMDYRGENEILYIEKEVSEYCDKTIIHKRKELENFLLVPDAIDRAVEKRIKERVQRGGRAASYSKFAEEKLEKFCAEKKPYITSQRLARRRRFARASQPGIDESVSDEQALAEIDLIWNDASGRFGIVPGKEALGNLNGAAQDQFGVSVTPAAIIEAMRLEEIPDEMKNLVMTLNDFRRS